MKKFWIQFVALALFILGVMYFTFQTDVFRPIGLPNTPGQQSKLKIFSTDGREVIVNIEIADNEAKRRKGLGGREKLEKDAGMLFIFDNPTTPTFWMKGLTFSLDFIWIKDNKVVDLLPNISPPAEGTLDDDIPRLKPITEVDRVLEVNSGFIAEKNIQIGDMVEVLR